MSKHYLCLFAISLCLTLLDLQPAVSGSPSDQPVVEQSVGRNLPTKSSKIENDADFPPCVTGPGTCVNISV